MLKKAQTILDNEIKNIVISGKPQLIKASLIRLSNLAGILDSMGAQADADLVDDLIKRASGEWMDFLGGLFGGAATTKGAGGEWYAKMLLNAARSGDWSKVLDKKLLVNVVTNAITGAVIATMTAEIINALTEKMPIFSVIKDSTFTTVAIKGALSYAIFHSDFITTFVDHIVIEIEKALGMEVKEEVSTVNKTQQSIPGVVNQPASEKSMFDVGDLMNKVKSLTAPQSNVPVKS